MVWEDATLPVFPEHTGAGELQRLARQQPIVRRYGGNEVCRCEAHHGRPAELVLGRGVTPNFFDVLGVRPLLGRSSHRPTIGPA